MPNEKTNENVTIQGPKDANIPGHPRTEPLLWPQRHFQAAQIQQTKGSAKPQATNINPTTLPAQSSVSPRTTPASVSNVRVVLRSSSGQKQVTVQFTHPSGDPYFQGANIYLRHSGKQPTQVAGGAQSPLTFNVANNSAPHSVYVTSFGNWGETPVLTSPAQPVRLS